MPFRVNQRVMVTRANHEQEARWVVGKMDQCIGQPATVKNVNLTNKTCQLVMDSKKALDHYSDYWFEEDLVEALDEEDAEIYNDEEEEEEYDGEEEEEGEGDRWFVGKVSGNVFKLIKIKKDIIYCVDQFGDEVSSEYMKLREEPNCTGFGWSP